MREAVVAGVILAAVRAVAQVLVVLRELAHALLHIEPLLRHLRRAERAVARALVLGKIGRERRKVVIGILLQPRRDRVARVAALRVVVAAAVIVLISAMAAAAFVLTARAAAVAVSRVGTLPVARAAASPTAGAVAHECSHLRFVPRAAIGELHALDTARSAGKPVLHRHAAVPAGEFEHQIVAVAQYAHCARGDTLAEAYRVLPAGLPDHIVPAAKTMHVDVVARTACERVIARAAVEHVVSRTAVQCVVAGIVQEQVVARLAVQSVVARVADHDVGQRIAVAGEIVAAEKMQLLHVRSQSVVGRAVHRVVALIEILDDLVGATGSRIDVIDVIALAAAHIVETFPAIDDVIVGRARQHIVVVGADNRLSAAAAARDIQREQVECARTGRIGGVDPQLQRAGRAAGWHAGESAGRRVERQPRGQRRAVGDRRRVGETVTHVDVGERVRRGGEAERVSRRRALVGDGLRQHRRIVHAGDGHQDCCRAGHAQSVGHGVTEAVGRARPGFQRLEQGARVIDDVAVDQADRGPGRRAGH